MNKKLSLLEPGSDRAKQLSGLVRSINGRVDTIEQLKSKAREGVGQYLREIVEQGLELIMAKEIVPHGHWMQWVKNNCPLISHDTANVWMNIARNSERVLNSGVESLRAAQRLCEDNSKESGNESGEVKQFPIEQQILNRFCREFERCEKHYEQVKSPEVFDAIRLKAIPFVRRFFPEVEPIMKGILERGTV